MQPNKPGSRRPAPAPINMRILIPLLCLLLPGCAALRPKPKPPAATVTTAAGTILTQTGDAQVPASVSTKTTTQSMTLPTGTLVWQNREKDLIQYQLARDTPLTTTVRAEEAKAPQSFTPPAPPTPAEEADGKAVLYYRIGVVVGIAAALFGLVRDYTMVMVGGGCVAGACLFGLFVKSHPALLVIIGLGVALKFVGPILWHTQLKHLPAKTP